MKMKLRGVKSFMVVLTCMVLEKIGHTSAEGGTKASASNGSRSTLQLIDKSERQKTIDKILNNYDPRIPPNYEEDFPVDVYVQLHITNIDSISESSMDFAVGMFIRQTWNDTRLKYDKLPRLRSLELDTRLMDMIWVPDLFIANEKKANFHTVTVPNKLMHIYPEGRVQYSVRITATLQCNMNLRKYPMDTQRCYIMLESYGYSTETLVFKWRSNPVVKDPRLTLAQFEFGETKTLRCDKSYVNVNYTCLMYEFVLIRSFGFYITQVYIPSVLIVILSWVSFWLDIDAVPARISLGLLTVLTMTTQSSGARASLPKVSYVKAIDVWMAACLIFVFAGLIEFAYVNVHTRVEKRRRSESCMIKPGQCNNDDTDMEEKLANNKRTRFSYFTASRQKARALDRISRILFPASFIVFNLVYWLVYMLWIPESQDVGP
ncbi:ligand-gated ion channel [Mactra antiquata]